MSDIYGEKGFELFALCFDKLKNKDLDSDFREKVMLASTLGGIQIALTGTSLPHGMGYPLTYYKNVPHGLANGVLTPEYLKTFKNQPKINKMLDLCNLSSLDELAQLFDNLFDLNINISQEEIRAYSELFMSQKDKLKNHTEEISLDDVIKIYSNSLLK